VEEGEVSALCAFLPFLLFHHPNIVVVVMIARKSTIAATTTTARKVIVTSYLDFKTNVDAAGVMHIHSSPTTTTHPAPFLAVFITAAAANGIHPLAVLGPEEPDVLASENLR